MGGVHGSGERQEARGGGEEEGGGGEGSRRGGRWEVPSRTSGGGVCACVRARVSRSVVRAEGVGDGGGEADGGGATAVLRPGRPLYSAQLQLRARSQAPFATPPPLMPRHGKMTHARSRGTPPKTALAGWSRAEPARGGRGPERNRHAPLAFDEVLRLVITRVWINGASPNRAAHLSPSIGSMAPAWPALMAQRAAVSCRAIWGGDIHPMWWPAIGSYCLGSGTHRASDPQSRLNRSNWPGRRREGIHPTIVDA